MASFPFSKSTLALLRDLGEGSASWPAGDLQNQRQTTTQSQDLSPAPVMPQRTLQGSITVQGWKKVLLPCKDQQRGAYLCSINNQTLLGVPVASRANHTAAEATRHDNKMLKSSYYWGSSSPRSHVQCDFVTSRIYANPTRLRDDSHLSQPVSIKAPCARAFLRTRRPDDVPCIL
jgi:hypothetical protein